MPKSVVVIGAATLDRILHVPTYPKPDTKAACKTFESGGGNAANTASALGRLFLSSSRTHITDPDHTHVKLLSKISTDEIGQALSAELEEYGVDLTSPLCIRAEGTSPVVTVIVTNVRPYTRTCLFDAGTVGTLIPSDLELQGINITAVLDNTIHFHSDTRHTEVALALANEAKIRGITISVDCERDRFSAEFDELIDLANIVFTNEDLMETILRRRLDCNHPFEGVVLDGDSSDRERFGFYVRVATLCHLLTKLQQWRNTTNENGVTTPKELIVTRYVPVRGLFMQ